MTRRQQGMRALRFGSVFDVCPLSSGSASEPSKEQGAETRVIALDPRLTQFAREILDSARAVIRRGEEAPTREELVEKLQARLAEARAPYLREVVNATGVIIHTNLGRAPLSERAIEQVVAVARGYSNLEFDLASGDAGIASGWYTPAPSVS